MLFSYIVGHVHVNFRKRYKKTRKLLRKYKSKGFFYTPFTSKKLKTHCNTESPRILDHLKMLTFLGFDLSAAGAVSTKRRFLTRSPSRLCPLRGSGVLAVFFFIHFYPIGESQN